MSSSRFWTNNKHSCSEKQLRSTSCSNCVDIQLENNANSYVYCNDLSTTLQLKVLTTSNKIILIKDNSYYVTMFTICYINEIIITMWLYMDIFSNIKVLMCIFALWWPFLNLKKFWFLPTVRFILLFYTLLIGGVYFLWLFRVKINLLLNQENNKIFNNYLTVIEETCGHMSWCYGNADFELNIVKSICNINSHRITR